MSLLVFVFVRFEQPEYASLLRTVRQRYSKELLQGLGNELQESLVTPEAVMHEALDEFSRFESNQKEGLLLLLSCSARNRIVSAKEGEH